jgi:hypothetical protein
MGKKVSYNALDFQAFLEVLWGGHIQSQLFSNKRSIENTTQSGPCQSLFISDYGFKGSPLKRDLRLHSDQIPSLFGDG